VQPILRLNCIEQFPVKQIFFLAAAALRLCEFLFPLLDIPDVSPNPPGGRAFDKKAGNAAGDRRGKALMCCTSFIFSPSPQA
jgi:hypothetical protein